MISIAVLEGDWIRQNYYQKIRPVLQKNNIPIFRHRILPLTHLYNQSFWSNFPTLPTSFVSLDPRHWYFDDDTFLVYAKHVALLPIEAVFVFDSPFGYEMPSQIPVKEFEKVLSHRTHILSDVIKNSKSRMKIISPAIRKLKADLQERYLNYFVHHKSCFDAYAVHCCTETTDHSLGALTGFLNQVLSISHKPVWVTKWSVPSCDHSITSSKLINPSHWSQIDSKTASVKMKNMFHRINEVAKNDIRWMFIGSSEDIYHPDKNIPSFQESIYLPYQSDHISEGWEASHFLGLINYSGEVKSNILDTLVQISSSNQ